MVNNYIYIYDKEQSPLTSVHLIYKEREHDCTLYILPLEKCEDTNGGNQKSSIEEVTKTGGKNSNILYI